MTQKLPDIVFQAYSEHECYRLSPNPDAPPNEGFKYGAVLEWTDLHDRSDESWNGYFFIAPEAIGQLAVAFTRAAEDVKSD